MKVKVICSGGEEEMNESLNFIIHLYSSHECDLIHVRLVEAQINLVLI